MGRKQIRCHGDDRRFEVMADLIGRSVDPDVKHIADVAGGRGLLSRLLKKRYNLDSVTIDPRRHVLKGVGNVPAPFCAEDAPYYDLVVGLHPDGATRAVVESALVRPTFLIPCCNFWSTERIGLNELLRQIASWYDTNGIEASLERAGFQGPYNWVFRTRPPPGPATRS